jgi:hypothetical protein
MRAGIVYYLKVEPLKVRCYPVVKDILLHLAWGEMSQGIYFS